MTDRENKTEKLNLRVQPSVKERLLKYADQHKWSTNQAACILFDTNLPKCELSGNSG